MNDSKSSVLKSVWEIVSAEVHKEYLLGNFKKPLLALSLGFGGLYYITDKIAIEKKFPGFQEEPTKEKSYSVKADGQPREKTFLQRMTRLFPIILPTLVGPEVFYIVVLGTLLTVRTYLSSVIADTSGRAARYMVSRRVDLAVRELIEFLVLTIPASFVNSGLKYFTTMLALCFRMNLNRYVHNKYLKGVTFYNVCNLGKFKIDNVSERITGDIEKFSQEVSDVYASTFKPMMDIILFTLKLANNTSWRGPFIIYSYFALSSLVKLIITPPFGKLGARESQLAGDFRSAHERLITNSEEVAFYDGSKRERTIINQKMEQLHNQITVYALSKSFVGVIDNLLVKYWATIAGYLAIFAPIISGQSSGKSAMQLTEDYARNTRYLSNLADAISSLVLLSNKISLLKGHAKRVGEIVERLDDADKNEVIQFTRITEESEFDSGNKGHIEEIVQEWRAKVEANRPKSEVSAQSVFFGEVEVVEGENIEFEHIDIISPDGKLLAEDLSFSVTPGCNVMITGPNGAGKSSLFRLIGELWPPHRHHLDRSRMMKPKKRDILFVPQKPYLVLGTLRDQIIYPHSQEDMKAQGFTDDDLEKLLSIVDPKGYIRKSWQWDEQKDWFHAFSGGQKQRVAMARLFYHRPKFAILDECTSAVSDEVEDEIYQTCNKLGITLFTVSHRKYLRKHHSYLLTIEGREGKWSWKKITADDSS